MRSVSVWSSLGFFSRCEFINALLFRKSLMLLNIQKTQHFLMYIFPLLILKPKIYYKWSIFANDDQIWEDK